MCVTVSRLEADLELRTCASKFLEVYSTKTYELATISPDLIQDIELVEGEWGVPGFKILVTYTIDGKIQVAKEVVEDINVTDQSITFKVIEGDLLGKYNSFKFIIKLTSQILEGSVVTWTMEYEKPTKDTSDPNSLMQFVLQVSKHIDAHILSLMI